MAVTLSAEVLEDQVAVSLATVMASANRRARELGVDVLQSMISITQHSSNGGWVWQINYGPRDYVRQRGGDLIVEVDPDDATVTQVLWGQ